MPVTERGRLDWLALPAPALLNPDVGLLLESGAGFISHNFLKVSRRVVLRHNFHPLSSSFCPVQAVRPRHRANGNAFVNSPSAGNVHSNTHSIPTSLFYFCSHLATTRHDFVAFPSRLCRRRRYGLGVRLKSQRLAERGFSAGRGLQWLRRREYFPDSNYFWLLCCYADVRKLFMLHFLFSSRGIVGAGDPRTNLSVAPLTAHVRIVMLVLRHAFGTVQTSLCRLKPAAGVQFHFLGSSKTIPSSNRGRTFLSM
jgi:hypothetical protein